MGLDHMNRTTFISASFIGSLLIATSALAADAEKGGASGAYDWRGSYVGLQAGYGFSGNADIDDSLGLIFDVDQDGFLGGALFGYNFQSGNIVFGIDSDLSAALIDGETFIAATLVDHELRSLTTTRFRIGYAFDNVLPYVTGGVATSFAHFEGDNPGFNVSETDLTIGWTAGAGLEVGLTPNIRGRLQYNYVDLGTAEFDVFFGTVESDINLHIVRAGVSIQTKAIVDFFTGN